MSNYRPSGPGGMNRDHCDSGVRLVHTPTGTVVESCEDRMAPTNEKIAMKRLRTILYERQLNKMTASEQAARKLQVREVEHFL